MKTIQETIKEMNDNVKATFGVSNSCLVARCPAFGHDDNVVIFSGPDCAKAAQLFLDIVPNGEVTTKTTEFMGLVKKFAEVVWQ